MYTMYQHIHVEHEDIVQGFPIYKICAFNAHFMMCTFNHFEQLMLHLKQTVVGKTANLEVCATDHRLPSVSSEVIDEGGIFVHHAWSQNT